MIYGVTILLNDVSYPKNKGMQVETRVFEEGFFTNRKAATDFYQWHLKRWKSEKSISYGNSEQRGRAEMYKATIQNGKIMNHGINIYKETTY